MKKKSFLNSIFRFLKIVLVAVAIALIFKAFIIEAFRIPTRSMENTLLPGDYLLVNKFIYGAKTPKQIPFTDIELPRFSLPAITQPKLNDLIVFEFPYDNQEYKYEFHTNYIKRCIGTPGDKLEIINRTVFINDSLIHNPEEALFIKHKSRPRSIPNPKIFPPESKWNEDYYGPITIPSEGDTIKLNKKNYGIYAPIIEYELDEETVKVKNQKVYVNGNEITEYVLKQDYFFVLGDNRDESADSRFWGFVPNDKILGQAFVIYWSVDETAEPSGIIDFIKSIRWKRMLNFL